VGRLTGVRTDLDPTSPDYDPEAVDKLVRAAAEYAEYSEELEERGWDRAERFGSPPPPGFLTPEDAQRYPVGSRVRFTEDVETSDGDAFNAGELAWVIEHRLTPHGSVQMTLRGSDRRRKIVSRDTVIELAVSVS
jgi:hypothetical protein